MLSLSSLLNTEPAAPAAQPIDDRGEHFSYPPPWKGSGGGKKKGSQSALSALTLLAFLFFLNLLQNCLQDQMQNTAPIVIMMTTTTTTTSTVEGTRLKREDEPFTKNKGETGMLNQTNMTARSSADDCFTATYGNPTAKFGSNP